MRKFVLLNMLVLFCAAVLLAACAADEGASNNRNSSVANITANANKFSQVSTTATPAATATVQATPGDGVRRITVTELRDALNKGEAVVIDVRSEQGYAAGHIKGARLIPEDQITARVKELPRNKMIVTYCA